MRVRVRYACIMYVGESAWGLRRSGKGGCKGGCRGLGFVLGGFGLFLAKLGRGWRIGIFRCR